jgi:periplasmic copper chaperone A
MTLRTLRRASAAALAAAAIALSACVPEGAQRVGDLHIEAPWVRATPPGASVSGGFLVIRNRGDRDDRLVSATSSAVTRVEMHEMRHEDGMMKMRPLRDGIAIPAGSEVTLQPGGYHLMMIEPKQPFAGGDVVVASLHFEHAGDVEVAFRVRGAGATADSGHHH